MERGNCMCSSSGKTLTNAVCHGRASQVALVLDEENLLIAGQWTGAAPDPSRQEAGLPGSGKKWKAGAGNWTFPGPLILY